MSVGHFLDCWPMWESPAHWAWCHPWAGGPGRYKKSSWIPEPRNKPVSSVPNGLCFNSCLLPSTLTSFHDGYGQGLVGWQKLFCSPSWLWSWSRHSNREANEEPLLSVCRTQGLLWKEQLRKQCIFPQLRGTYASELEPLWLSLPCPHSAVCWMRKMLERVHWLKAECD